MDQKNNNLKFKNVIGHKPINNSINLNNERNLVKSRIMNKYNVSSKEADKILFELEKRNENRVKIKNIQKDYSQNDLSLDDEHVLNKENFNKNAVTQQIESNKNKIPFGLDKPNVVERVQDENNGIIINEQSNQKIGLIPNKQITNENEVVFRDAKEKGNVDSILEEIIPNYNQQISINLEHVDLTFEVQNEKIDTIKEKVIRTLKRNNSKKIKIHALNDVSFKIYKGEKVGIIGYNGAGKSTLLNLIAGIYPPDNGTVTTCGNISPLLSLGAGFDPNFSGRKNIILNGAILGYDKDFLESKIDKIIEFSELGEFIDIPIKNYSSGMLAKLGFSIATFVNPDILIIDEILGVGDVNFQKKSSDKIRSLMDGGTTVLFVSHSIPQVRSICDKAIWINNGCVRAFGEVNKICDMYLEDAERASRQQLENINLY